MLDHRPIWNCSSDQHRLWHAWLHQCALLWEIPGETLGKNIDPSTLGHTSKNINYSLKV